MVEAQLKTGVLLPAEALALLGSGRQGAAAIGNYRIASSVEFEAEFAGLMGRLAASGEAEAPSQLALSYTLAAAARDASGWVSLRADDDAFAPAIILLGGGATVAAVLHGYVVEFVVGGDELAARVIRGALQKNPDADVRLALFDGDEVLAGVRFAGGRADLAAKDPDRLKRLSAAGSEGLEQLIDELRAESAR